MKTIKQGEDREQDQRREQTRYGDLILILYSTTICKMLITHRVPFPVNKVITPMNLKLFWKLLHTFLTLVSELGSSHKTQYFISHFHGENETFNSLGRNQYITILFLNVILQTIDTHLLLFTHKKPVHS